MCIKKEMIIIGILLVFTFGFISGCFGPQTTDYFNGEYDVDDNTILKVTTIN